MSGFNDAAIERLARLAQLTPGSPGEGPAMSAGALVRRAVESGIGELFARNEAEYWMFASAEESRLAEAYLDLTRLLELAARAGYVRLERWSGRANLVQSVTGLLGRNAESGTHDLTLVHALERRLSGAESVPAAGVEAVAAFESFLVLTEAVREDSSVRHFVNRSDRTDASALVSPRHFAEAFETGVVDGVPVTDVAAGCRLLDYLEWLADIAATLGEHPDLRAGMLRFDRWVERAVAQEPRFAAWIERMREWDTSSEWSEAGWKAFSAHVFERLGAALAGASESKQPGESDLAVEFELEPATIEQQLEQLQAQGRPAAALRRAREDALQFSRTGASGSDWINWAETLVRKCTTLAELGGEAAAGAILAPVMDELLDRYARSGYQVVADAQDLMARARHAAAAPPPTVAAEHEASPSSRTSSASVQRFEEIQAPPKAKFRSREA